MADRFYDVTCSRLTFCTKHRRTFSDSAGSFTQVATATHKWHCIVFFIQVELLIGRGQNFALIDIINAHSLKYTSLNNMPNSRLRHYRDGDGFKYLFDYSWVSHSCDAACCSDIRRNTL